MKYDEMGAPANSEPEVDPNADTDVIEVAQGVNRVLTRSEAVDIIEEICTYHAPEGDQGERYNAIRGALRVFLRAIDNNCPPCADRSSAIRKAREAAMTANAAIALRGLV